MNTNKKFLSIAAIAVLIPILALRLFVADFQATQSDLYKKVDKILEKENFPLENSSYEIATAEKDGEYYVFVTDIDSMKERVFFVDDKATDLTKEFQKTEEMLLSKAKGNKIKKIYSPLKEVTDTKYAIDVYKKLEVSRIHKAFKTKSSNAHIQMATYNFLYESEDTKEIVKEKSIIYINGKEVLNEVRDYEEIRDIIKKSNLKLPISPIAYITLNNQKVLVYFDKNVKDIQYIVNKGDKIQKNDLNKDIREQLNNYIK